VRIDPSRVPSANGYRRTRYTRAALSGWVSELPCLHRLMYALQRSLTPGRLLRHLRSRLTTRTTLDPVRTACPATSMGGVVPNRFATRTSIPMAPGISTTGRRPDMPTADIG
jgi:hypothetical protein